MEILLVSKGGRISWGGLRQFYPLSCLNSGFLDSKSTSCTRIFANLSESCVTDPALDAASYYRDFSVLKVRVAFLPCAQHRICLIFHSGFSYLEN